MVKAQYKVLVKKYHPDATGGDKAAEERFKEISAAYRKVVRALEG
jgi:curved DNA-binding protein CbpA